MVNRLVAKNLKKNQQHTLTIVEQLVVALRLLVVPHAAVLRLLVVPHAFLQQITLVVVVVNK